MDTQKGSHKHTNSLCFVAFIAPVVFSCVGVGNAGRAWVRACSVSRGREYRKISSWLKGYTNRYAWERQTVHTVVLLSRNATVVVECGVRASRTAFSVKRSHAAAYRSTKQGVYNLECGHARRVQVCSSGGIVLNCVFKYVHHAIQIFLI